MGCGSSSGSRSTAPEPRVSRNEFYDGHPGLHNKPSDNIESEIATRVRKPDPNDTVTINVKNIDLNVTENSQAHFTDEYEIVLEKKLLVIRRGQSFDVDIEFSREYDRARDDLRIVFRFGENPRPRRKTHVELILSDTDQKGQWGAHLKSKDGNSVKITIVSPPDCLVGKWTLNIDVVKRFESETSVCRHEHPEPIYVLFNPWCEADSVYMHETSKLTEYVLKDTGNIYRGSSKRVSRINWAFGQFEDIVLDCAMFLLDKMSKISDNARGDPILIVRKISALVNAPNDGGVLVGNWSGKYTGGTSPLDWTGSVKILEQFYQTKMPVKYGQCWVFSGIVTTLCRTLGIPTRSVTNFVSAHDTDKTITIDTYFDEDKKKMKDLISDSVWNFHVWNDVWMARPDLPKGYGGWQAIDATPQETSDGVYCLGPTSLKAVKYGELYLPYDGPFVFAEVNADRLVWMVLKDGTFDLKRTISHSIGKFLLSNGVTEKHDDVTRDYKFKEGTEEERAAVKQANLSSILPGVYDTGPEDVEFNLQIKDDTFMGDTVVVKLKVKNLSGEERIIDGHITVASMYYTGVHYQDILNNEITSLVLQASEEKEILLQIEENQYLNLLMDHCMLNVSCLCLAKQTNQTFFEVEELRLRKPHLEVTTSDQGKVGSSVEVETTFTNPLNVMLTGCQLSIEGPGLRKPLTQMYGNVEAKKKFVGKFDLIPAKRGNREVVVNFSCNQIRSVNGSHKILIE